MSKTVSIVIAVGTLMAPAGTVFGALNVTLGTEPPRVVAATKGGDGAYVASIDVSGVAAGNYALQAQSVDANGSGLGAAISATVTLLDDAAPPAPAPAPAPAPDQVAVDAPTSMSVTVA